jgi:hypothetical protein
VYHRDAGLLLATGITQTSVTLTWTDNAVGETWHYINGTGNTIIMARSAGTGAMSRTVTGLTAGTKYCFEIHAMSNGYGWSPAMLRVTTASAPPLSGGSALARLKMGSGFSDERVSGILHARCLGAEIPVSPTGGHAWLSRPCAA